MDCWDGVRGNSFFIFSEVSPSIRYKFSLSVNESNFSDTPFECTNSQRMPAIRPIIASLATPSVGKWIENWLAKEKEVKLVRL